MGRNAQRAQESAPVKFPGPAPGPAADQEARASLALPARAARNLDFVMTSLKQGEKMFSGRLRTHADWVLIQVLFENEAAGRGTVVRDVIQAAGGSPGMVRAIFQRFKRAGYIGLQQKVGRQELYQPTAKLRAFIVGWSEALAPLI